MIFLLTMSYLLSGCHHSTPVLAWYHWKSVYNPSQNEKAVIDKSNVQKMYLHFFDIVWDKEYLLARPEAILHLRDSIPASLNIIPMIYITNEAILKTAAEKIPALADSISQLTGKLARRQNIQYAEIQIDGDWTAKSAENYFTLLQNIKENTGHTLSATLRLHQIKYPKESGIPPIDKGVLMFYNMGDLSPDLQKPNSIYNKAAAAGYLDAIKNYPLKMSVALPAFSWVVHISDGHITALHNNWNLKSFADTLRYSITENPLQYLAVSSFFTDGVYVKKGDTFNNEIITFELLEQAASQLANAMPYTPAEVIYYKIDGLDTYEFTSQKIQCILDRF